MRQFRLFMLIGCVGLAVGCAPRPTEPIPTVAEFPTPQVAVPEQIIQATVVEPTSRPINELPPTWTPTPIPTQAPAVNSGASSNSFASPTPPLFIGDLITFSRQPDGNTPRDVYIVDIANDITRNLTNNSVTDTDPAWSPLNPRIAFVSDRDNQTDIYLIDEDGGDFFKLTNDEGIEQNPQWAQDGSKVAFISNEDNPLGELYTVASLPGAEPFRVVSGQAVAEFTWSNDSRTLAFTAGDPAADDARLYTVNADGSNLNWLLFADDDLNTVTDPAWSPDNTRLAASCDDMLCFVNADGSGFNKTSNAGRKPAWSPDGTFIAYVCPAGELEHICLISRNGTNRFQVTEGAGGRVLNTPQWSPNGSMLAFDFIPQEDATAGLYILDVLTNQQRPVVQVPTAGDNGIFGISWQPQ